MQVDSRLSRLCPVVGGIVLGSPVAAQTSVGMLAPAVDMCIVCSSLGAFTGAAGVMTHHAAADGNENRAACRSCCACVFFWLPKRRQKGVCLMEYGLLDQARLGTAWICVRCSNCCHRDGVCQQTLRCWLLRKKA